jgi:hypothetical protein
LPKVGGPFVFIERMSQRPLRGLAPPLMSNIR